MLSVEAPWVKSRSFRFLTVALQQSADVHAVVLEKSSVLAGAQ